MKFVQFSDSSATNVVSVFSCAQDATVYPNQAEVSDNDARYLAYMSPAPTAAQLGQSALYAGLTVSSTGTPSINGTYSCDDASTSNFAKVEGYVTRNNTFPGPSSTQPWVLKNGSVVVIPNTAVFNALATAIANYAALISVYIYSNGASGSLPASSITIA